MGKNTYEKEKKPLNERFFFDLHSCGKLYSQEGHALL